MATTTMRDFARVAATVTLVLAAAGCSTLSSLNPFALAEPKVKPADLGDIRPTLTVRQAWAVPVGISQSGGFVPVLTAGHVIAAGSDGTVVRIDANSGQPVWRINVGQALTAGVGSDGATTAVGTAKGEVLAIDAEGRLKWKAQASSEILAAPSVGQGLVVVRSADNRIFAFDADTGKRRWVYQRTAPALTLRLSGGMLLTGSAVYAGFPGGRMVALALNNGSIRWESTVANPKGATELERIADVVGAPVQSGRDVCAVTFQGRVACFDSITGTAGWSRDTSSVSGMGMDTRFVYVTDDKSIVAAFARSGGASTWRQDKLLYRDVGAPAAGANAVVVGDGKGFVHWLDRVSGQFAARASTDGSRIWSAPLAIGNSVVVQTGAGNLYSFVSE